MISADLASLRVQEKDAVAIRKARRSDRQALVEIIESTENINRSEKDCAIELLDIYLKDPGQKDYYFIVAADENGLPAGYVCYGKTPLTDGVFDLYWILVDGKNRCQGTGTKLLAHTEELVRKDGARMLVAETSGLSAYEPARRFYRRNGFKEEAKIKDFYKPGDDLITYIKRF